MADARGLLGHAISVLVVLAIGVAVYAGGRHVEYQWRWERLPQYVLSTGGEEIVAPFDGEAKLGPDGRSVTVANAEGRSQTFSGLEVVQVYDGEIVFVGNTLGRVPGVRPGPLLLGLWLTLQLSVASLLVAFPIGVLVGLGRVARNVTARDLAAVYVELIRGTPLLVQLYIVYFFVAPVLELSAFTSGVVGLAVFTAAYIAEIVRGGIEAVPRGQTEAARSLGMSGLQAMRYVVLPQAIRKTLPSLAGQFINLIKDSSLVSVMALSDLTKTGREIVSSTFSPFEVWFSVAALYLVLTGTLSWLVRRLERRMAND
ncbi:MAG TPA: amino acid ABC transporter permease [Nevskiaceae bacterium]|nr:amino acid ABC transporter permease [Nevskiaceae bacterium]